MGQPRGYHGRFAKGGTLSKEHRLKISKAQLESHARRRVEREPIPDPETKVCTVCGEDKPLKTDYRKKKCTYKLANGKKKVVYYWQSECNACAQARIDAWKERKKVLGEYDEHVKRWEKHRRDKFGYEYINKMHRKWYRKKQGQKFTLPWIRYRRGYNRQGIHYRTKEVLGYFDRFITEDHDNRVRLNGRALTDNQTRQLNRWRTGESKTVSEVELDKWATYFDLPLWEIEDVAVENKSAV